MSDFSSRYHKILCADQPDFIFEYASLPLVQRLKGIGLLCGTDWTPLYSNRFFYSRYDHSVGCALLVWNFTHDRKQALAALLHDVSTASFSHVNDFRLGDALTQTATENDNQKIILGDRELSRLLARDGIDVEQVSDYHIYTVADNKLPGLSGDRLEYMYPSGAAMSGEWSLEEIERSYASVQVLENEKGEQELGFDSQEQALVYTKKFCAISLILQRNENKLALQLMADILTRAIQCHIISEKDIFNLCEEKLIALFEQAVREKRDERFVRLFTAFRTMTKIEHTEKPVEGCYCVSLETKQRYVNPLVRLENGTTARICSLSEEADECVKQFLSYRDTAYGCIRL